MALARVLIKRGLPELGLAALSKSRIPEPMPLGVAIQLGRCYLAMHKIDEAYGAVSKHLNSAKNSLAMLLFLFDVMLAKGQPHDALKLLEKASELGKIAIDRKRVQAALTYECGHVVQALKILDEISEQRPDYAPGKKLADTILLHGLESNEEVGAVLLFGGNTLVPSTYSSDWVMLIEESREKEFIPPEAIATFTGMLHSTEVIPNTNISIVNFVSSEDLAVFEGEKVWDVLPLLMNKLQTMTI
jgi:tetratricopeptide (TPR) repeat protein